MSISIKYFAFFILSSFISTAVFSQALNDQQTKLNISSISNPVHKLTQLKPISFEYNTKQYKQLNLQAGKQYGFLSENIQAVFPELVKEKRIPYMLGKNNYKNATISTINETSLIPVLVASIIEQQQQINQLKTEIEELRNKKGVTATR